MACSLRMDRKTLVKLAGLRYRKLLSVRNQRAVWPKGQARSPDGQPAVQPKP